MLFWIVSFALAALVAALLLRALAAGGGDAGGNADLGVYRDQLAEVDRDLARGVIDTAEAERARVEISRRILDADRTGGGAGTVTGSRIIPVVALALALAASVGLYLKIGAPGYPDLPIADRIARAESLRADRPSQAEAEAGAPPAPARAEPEASYLALMERLRAAVAENPGDVTGQRLLARNEAALGNFADAAKAQAQVVALAGGAATATDYATLADNYILATGGYVSPEAESALTKALERDPKNGTARFYTGLMWAQTGRPDLAFRFWRALLEEGPEDAPWIPPIRDQIDLLARAAGVNYTPPATTSLAGPSAADVAAAADMTAEERQAMIRTMVEGLSDRLATEGGSAEEWARLIFALAQLGEIDRAKAVWTEAQTRFAEHQDDLAAIRASAERAGIVE